MERAGGRALVLPTDVAGADAVEAAAARVEEELGPIDAWVSNAMVTLYAPVWQTTPDEFRRVTEVTYLVSVWGAMAALRRMLPRDAGVIVQVGSALAYLGIPLQAAYSGAKHALQGFLDSLRTELLHGGSGVRVTMVQLPALNTPQFGWCRTKMARKPEPVPIYQPEVAAEAIYWPRTTSGASSTSAGRRSGRSSATNRARYRRRLPQPDRLREPATRRAGRARPPGQPVRACARRPRVSL